MDLTGLILRISDAALAIEFGRKGFAQTALCQYCYRQKGYIEKQGKALVGKK